MGVVRNHHASIEERVRNGTGTDARAFFIHLGGHFKTVVAELPLLDLMPLVQ